MNSGIAKTANLLQQQMEENKEKETELNKRLEQARDKDRSKGKKTYEQQGSHMALCRALLGSCCGSMSCFIENHHD